MNGIVNKFLLSVDKFIPKLHLRQLGFTFSACGDFTKKKNGNTRDWRLIYKNELNKAYFQHDMAY